MKGYIKLHRRILDWEWYKDSNTKNIFIHLLLNACYDNCRFMGNAVSRGQYITSLSRLSADLDIPVRQVRTSLKKLVQTGEIDMQTSNKYSLITICNYESYQIEEAPKKRKATSKRQADDTQVTDINKNIIKKENKNNIYADECLSNTSWVEVVCMQNAMSVEQLQASIKNFTDHLLATDEVKYSLKDYKSHFINWLRYAKKQIKQDVQGSYRWKWKGQVIKTGTLDELNKDKKLFDQPGFEFKIISNG